MHYRTRIVMLAIFAFIAFSRSTEAGAIMPSFDNAPTGWMTDRYQPAGFADIGNYQGRDNVLGISIDRSDGSTARPSGQGGAFYNTQGMKYSITGGAGDFLEADLWVDSSWFAQDANNVRTDMWGRTGLVGNETGVTYPIFGFTNYGGATFRVWDSDSVNGWVNLGTNGITQDAWNSLRIAYNGNSFMYYLNNVLVYTDGTVGTPNAQFTDVMMQAYNFFDPTLTGARADNYSVRWSNTPTNSVPEPGPMGLLVTGILGLFAVQRRRSRSRS